ncbi:hypothetical protein [Flavihumibacter sp. CACIAM 22H1]|uniref:hypothetical protein n=1 Tax=Flavihumibacter sp. CACIAM 22H1 TaxID=1812911 RepID=UPI0007A7E9EB|nr:hypothetical protein [Flavihumibacter sp. CACIAM 22H1]KYP14770.1 MAG: hypothetical protein A1D16_05675 [Flavihumibacter sp. CACIAM 22H1]
MNVFLKVVLLLTGLFTGTQSISQVKELYEGLASRESSLIDAQLKKLENSNSPADYAYTGALLMKKADVVKGPANKLETFRAGKEKLEKAIQEDNENVEFRFLRLLIQENAPGILGYDKNIAEDASLVAEKFNELPKEVKEVVQSYSKSSRALRDKIK